MATDTIPARSNGQTIDENWFNLLRTVLGVDHVPRNSSGVATAVGGSLGSATYPWLKLFLGLAASGLSIEESSGGIIMKIGGVKKFELSSTGYQDGQYLKAASVPSSSMAFIPKFTVQDYTANNTFVCPSGVTELFAILVGGGGGGGSAGGAAPSGGGGGGGGSWIISRQTVSPAASYSITIGAGGAAGAANADGVVGGDTSFSSLVTARGGAPGYGSTSISTIVTDLQSAFDTLSAAKIINVQNYLRAMICPTTGGTAGGMPGAAGSGTPTFAGGAAGAGGTYQQGGGGGAGLFGTGGAGGNSGAGVAASANTGGGGGGGDLNSAGAAGGAGRVILIYPGFP